MNKDFGLFPPKETILGLPFHCSDGPAAVRLAEDIIRARLRSQIVFLNAHSIVMARRDQHFRGAVESSRLVLCDSTPLFWFSKALGSPLPGRVAGPDFCEALCRLAADESFSVYFLGSTSETLQRMVGNLRQKFPSLQVAGVYSPPMRQEFTSEDTDEMIRRINIAAPDVLWVGITAPKQEKWVFDNLSRLNCVLAIGVGAAFDFLAGTKRRAPVWLQAVGLEWFFRLCQEPGRLWRRYLINNTLFVALCLREIVRVRLGGDSPRS
ncbi:MAG: WecB/TagA/CpsF family glycosyltransferase [Elusimicrobiota bacterium]